jgi:DNA-binding XRE family transcriptional regulator
MYRNIVYLKLPFIGRAGPTCPAGMVTSVFSAPYSTMLAALIELRKERGVSQVELAARIGKNQQFVSSVERGLRRIDVVEFYAITKALGFDPAVAFVRVVEGFPDNVAI